MYVITNSADAQGSSILPAYLKIGCTVFIGRQVFFGSAVESRSLTPSSARFCTSVMLESLFEISAYS